MPINKIMDIMDKPEIIKVENFDLGVLSKFKKGFDRAINSAQPIIPIVINSFGGFIDVLFAMIDTIDQSPKPVATICEGKALSAGAVLLTCGREGLRFAGPLSRIMLHEISANLSGKNEEVQAYSKEMEHLNKVLLERASINCGHKKNYFKELSKDKMNIDMLFSVDQAKEHNIINHIGLPKMEVTIDTKVKVSFRGCDLEEKMLSDKTKVRKRRTYGKRTGNNKKD